jgi:hypothetical protein
MRMCNGRSGPTSSSGEEAATSPAQDDSHCGMYTACSSLGNSKSLYGNEYETAIFEKIECLN